MSGWVGKSQQGWLTVNDVSFYMTLTWSRPPWNGTHFAGALRV